MKETPTTRDGIPVMLESEARTLNTDERLDK